MAFKPLHDRIAVERVSEQEKTAGGIIIPDTAQEKPSEGKVISVGPGTRKKDGSYADMEVRVGDRVLFGKWSGTEAKIDGKDILIMQESDVMGIIN